MRSPGTHQVLRDKESDGNLFIPFEYKQFQQLFWSEGDFSDGSGCSRHQNLPECGLIV
jgi:hypothetical protein